MAGVVGGLVAVELPVYQQYVIRARVTEGLTLASQFKHTVVENFLSGEALNSNSPGVGQPVFAPTPSVKNITVSESGEITITYQPSAGDGTLVLVPLIGLAALGETTESGGPVVWRCNAAASARPGNKGTLPPMYAPAQCRG